MNKGYPESPGARTSRRSTSEFFDALTAYAIDPTRWPELLEQLDRLSDGLESWDPGALVAELSRAESLSWRIKQDDLGQTGFAYLLLDATDRVTGSSEHLGSLTDYLTVDDQNRLRLTTANSQASLDAAKARLNASERGHSLVSLGHPEGPRQRFGFLISRAEFPRSLERVAKDATMALFINQDDGGNRLRNVVQASFGLTAAEADVTMELVQGLTLKETAGQLDISINTARNHLQAVFDKSGINRQSDLVLAVTQLSVILAGTEGTVIAASRGKNRRFSPRHFIILPDGRRMAYRTYGEPEGKPLLYLHETLGCSRLPPGTDELAVENGLYLIAPERPGFGFSDIDPAFSFASVTEGLRHLLNHLHIRQCAVLGFLSGGAYALWLAVTAADQVGRLILVGGRPPRAMKGRFKHLMPLYTKMISQPWLMTSFFNILRNRASPETNASLINSVYGSVPHDRAFLAAHPETFDHIASYTMESMTVTAGGIAGELKCFASAVPLDVSGLELPITAWHGLADNLAGIDDLKDFLQGREVKWHEFPDAGSLILFEHWQDILKDAASG